MAEPIYPELHFLDWSFYRFGHVRERTNGRFMDVYILGNPDGQYLSIQVCPDYDEATFNELELRHRELKPLLDSVPDEMFLPGAPTLDLVIEASYGDKPLIHKDLSVFNAERIILGYLMQNGAAIKEIMATLK